MDISSQQLNTSLLLPKLSAQRYQKQVQNGAVEVLVSPSTATDGGSAHTKRETVDSVSLSPAAHQAYAVANDPTRPINAVAQQQAEGDVSKNTPDQAVTPNRAVNAYQQQADVAAEEQDQNLGLSASGQPDSVQLTPEAQQKILELSQRDQEVKIHEAAHAAVGGQYAGAPSLSYETGPDGKRYAVSGEVNIDVSKVAGDPAATMKKADVIRAAALAPAQPSAQDRNVAASAAQMKAQAQAELMAETAEAAAEMVEGSVTEGRSSAVADDTLFNASSVRFSGGVA